MDEQLLLSKDDCGAPISVEEVRKVQLAMLDALAAFCDEHGLRYRLCGGTLLGAIRHRGYIPWDDDIDIMMPRPDVEKLMELTQGELSGYKLYAPIGKKWSPLRRLFYRMYDFDYIVEDFLGGATSDHPDYVPAFLDIFPMEGLPEGKFAVKIHYGKMYFCKNMQLISRMPRMISKRKIAHVIHFFARIPAVIVGYENWGKMIMKIAKKYDFEKSKFAGSMTSMRFNEEERMIKEDWLKTIEVTFEGKQYHAPSNYDTYLTQLYGDYMELPPVEKRGDHHALKFYRRKEAEV